MLQFEDLSYRLNFLPKENEIKKLTDNISLKCHNHLQFNYVLGNKKAMLYSMK